MRPQLAPWQAAAMFNPYEHFAMFGGVATGKSFTGANYSIDCMTQWPKLTGFIGANSYDQLNQATLRELFTQLENQKMNYVINRIPPSKWAAPQQFPSYRNILSVKVGSNVAHAFIRVLSDPDALRGIQFSWYHLDETRDTPENAHDIILSRMRQSKIRRGLITTTTNAEDWGYKRFALARSGQKLYGSMHVKTEESVKAGIIEKSYYDTLRHTYSELLAAQELDAMHVNVFGGRAYYAFDQKNRSYAAPWGDLYPNPSRPLIIGCDFNFDPSPHVWMIGQLGPPMYGPDGEYWGECIHWFSEISMNRASTVSMAQRLVNLYPGFMMRVYGDRSGMRATTSSAGVHDYHQIATVLTQHGVSFTIDSDQGNNPLVRNRVENMNRLARDGTGRVRMTYNPNTCPHFDGDVKQVGWKQNVRTGQGKLDSGGDAKKTHATDGAGYAVWKIFPPGARGRILRGTQSMSSQFVGIDER